MSVVRFILLAALFLALFFLALSNTEPVTLRWFNFASTQSPLAFVVFMAFAAGVAAGLVAGATRSVRLKRQLLRLRRQRRGSSPRPAPHGALPDAWRGGAEPPRDAV